MQGRISKNAKSSKNSNWKWVDLEIGAIAIMHKYGRFFYLPCTGKNLRISKDKFNHSRALRCTFFGEWKNSCSSKFVQLELLNKVKARSSKIRAA
jgi:hypothetical protein